ncbi:hypothetical protein PS652_03724 [Pseudomonas fluorescens]|uniref:Channel forming colicins domain-containing protein n=3 Tax=Pseudomonas TaxID=286 RepID=A0AAN2HF62_PSEFL
MALELATTIIYGDGSVEFISLNPGQVRGSILGNYPMGNPMLGAVIGIENDYKAAHANLEINLQKELDLLSSQFPPLADTAAVVVLERQVSVINTLLIKKNSELQTELKAVKSSYSIGKLMATYNATLLNEQVASLLERQGKLNAEITRQHAAIEAQRKAQEAARVQAEAKRKAEEAKRLADEKAKAEVDYKAALKFTADFYKDLAQKLGGQLAGQAQALAASAQGKRIGNAKEAMAAFEKYKDALNKKFSVKDRQAIAKALDSLNKEQMAKNLKQFSKAFGYVGKAIDYADLLTEIKKSYTTGEWSNTFLKVETLFAGSAASALLAVVFGAAASTAMGAVAFALLMAMTGAYIDEALVKKFNDAVIAL